MANALLELIEHPSMREDFRQAVLSRADGYSWDAISRRYLELA
jgi:glycosyltransferase involved in cell wall biosynthesis